MGLAKIELHDLSGVLQALGQLDVLRAENEMLLALEVLNRCMQESLDDESQAPSALGGPISHPREVFWIRPS